MEVLPINNQVASAEHPCQAHPYLKQNHKRRVDHSNSTESQALSNSSNTRQRTLPGFQVRGVRSSPRRAELKLINYAIKSTSTLKNFKLVVV